eukprot:10528916-Lingulodinium_polyedra.AAC.1
MGKTKPEYYEKKTNLHFSVPAFINGELVMVHWMRALSVDRDEYFATGRPTNLNEQFEQYLKTHEHCPVICPVETSDRAGH